MQSLKWQNLVYPDRRDEDLPDLTASTEVKIQSPRALPRNLINDGVFRNPGPTAEREMKEYIF